ncbi:hypothetical protein REPUB_Repub07fG0231300 [Reevesia pubescens]
MPGLGKAEGDVENNPSANRLKTDGLFSVKFAYELQLPACRGIISSSICSRCSTNDETILHALRDCTKSKEIWLSFGTVLGPDFFDLGLRDWILKNTSKNKKVLRVSLSTLFAVTSWYVWYWRNCLLHEEEFQGPSNAYQHVLSRAKESNDVLGIYAPKLKYIASTKMATAGGVGSVKGTSSREGTTKSIVTEQISQAVQSTSNLLHLMQQSSPSQTQLMKLPKNLLAKTPTIKNTGQMLELMPRVISSLDAHIDSGLQSVPHLKTVIQLLENMESCQLCALSQANLSQGDSQQANQNPEVGSPP